MEKSQLKPMLMITNIVGEQCFYKVSTLYVHHFTAILEAPIPARTTVRAFTYDVLDGFRPLTASEFGRYNRVWDEAKRRK